MAIFFRFYDLENANFHSYFVTYWQRTIFFDFDSFFVINASKRWQFLVLINASANGNVFRVKKSFISFINPILGHPVYQFLQKPEFSDFTVSGSGLPWGHRLWKQVSLCWSNSYFRATAPRGRDTLYIHL